MIKKFNKFINEEVYFRGGEYIPGKYRVDNGVDGKDDSGKSYDIKKGDFITILNFLSKTNAYMIKHEDTTYILPAEVIFSMELYSTNNNKN